MSFHGPHSELAKHLISVAKSKKRRVSAKTRKKLKKAKDWKTMSEESKAKILANLALAREKRWPKHTYTYTDCDFCGQLGPEEEKSTIRYEDEDACMGLCPRCFAEWQRKPDEAQIISIGKGQEQSA